MASGRAALTALHLLLVWATMACAVPAFGFGLLVTAWGGGSGAAAWVLALTALSTGCLLAVVGTLARTVVPLCRSGPRRLGWAALVLLLGTLGVLAGWVAYGEDVALESAATRFALTGVPYAVVAALLVPDRWVRLGALGVLAAGVVYGGFAGPAQARQRRHAAEVARYLEHPELLYVIDAPTGMRASRAEFGAASFVVEYHSVRQDAYVALTVRPSTAPGPRCPEPVEEHTRCAVDPQGRMRVVRDLPGGTRVISLTRHHGDAEVEITSQTMDESGLRRSLDTLHPLSTTELGLLMREGVVDSANGPPARGRPARAVSPCAQCASRGGRRT